MPYYRSTLLVDQGHTHHREVFAASQAEARALFEGASEKLVRVRRKWLKSLPLIRSIRRRIPVNEFLLFNQEMIILLKSGIPFIRAVEIIHANTRGVHLKAVLAQAIIDIRNGTQISDAFAIRELPFAKIYRASLLAGEKSGHLETVLEKFNVYLGKVHQLRRKTISSLTYPAVLFGFMVAMVAVVMVYVIPQFTEFFADFESSLPPATLFFVSLAEFSRQKGPAILIAILLLYAAVQMVERRFPSIIVRDQLKLRTPFFGPALIDNAMSVFSRTLAILISGGIPVPESAEIAVETFANRHLHAQIAHLPRQIREGNLLSQVLDGVAFVPKLVIEMIRVGETSGNLEEVLGESARYYEQVVDNRVQALISLIEPVIIIVLGLVVAFMLVSVYLPIFSVAQVIK